MPSSTLFLNPPSPPFFGTKSPAKIENKAPTRSNLRIRHRRGGPSSSKFVCKSSSSSSRTSWVLDFDLYELLGVDSSSDHSEIKKAYRALQKRCHPDIAGPAGHDMAIVLNEVYSLLSDPSARSAYDQEQATVSEFRGYTGKPLYSAWFGSENEQRAVFVDEIKCVGCLKCALHAKNTFAIESVYGRARAIAQWADPEDKILDAIQTCPVDCISMVDRSDLAALEFLMSKQPRGNVRANRGNIFADVNKFHNRFYEMKDRASVKESKVAIMDFQVMQNITNELPHFRTYIPSNMESELQRNSRMSAVRGIRSITDWWYWRPPSPATPGSRTDTSLIHVPRIRAEPDTERIREAAARFRSRERAARQRPAHEEEYWTPLLTLPSSLGSNRANQTAVASSSPRPGWAEPAEPDAGKRAADEKRGVVSLKAPLAMGAAAAAIVANGYGEMGGSGVGEHIGGAVALEVVNSFAMQVMLAGTTWFVIGLGVVGIFEIFGGKVGFRR